MENNRQIAHESIRPNKKEIKQQNQKKKQCEIRVGLQSFSPPQSWFFVLCHGRKMRYLQHHKKNKRDGEVEAIKEDQGKGRRMVHVYVKPRWRGNNT